MFGSMGNLAIIFASGNIPNLKVRHISENDRQVSHGPEHSKTEFKIPVRSFWYLLDKQSSHSPKVRALRSFSLLAHLEKGKFTVRPYGSARTPQIDPKSLRIGIPWCRDPEKPCIHITPNPNDLNEFKNLCVFFLRQSGSDVFFPYSYSSSML